MLRIFFKKKIIKKQRKLVIQEYKRISSLFKKCYSSIEHLYESNFSVTLPHRQQHFSFTDFKLNRVLSFSAGRYLLFMGHKSKYFKRRAANIVSIVLQLKRNFPRLLSLIYLFSLKNFNYRQFLFFKKLISIANPNIKYFMHKRSYLPKFLRKHRIRRRVLKMLKKA